MKTRIHEVDTTSMGRYDKISERISVTTFAWVGMRESGFLIIFFVYPHRGVETPLTSWTALFLTRSRNVTRLFKIKWPPSHFFNNLCSNVSHTADRVIFFIFFFVENESFILWRSYLKDQLEKH